MFKIQNAIVYAKPNRIPGVSRKGIIIIDNGKYRMKYKDTIYSIVKIDRFVGQSVYSTHINDKHSIGTKRILNTLDNLEIKNKYWFPIYKGMKVEFNIVGNNVVKLKL